MATDSPRSNPFATRYTAPGLLPWIAEASTELDELARKFLASNLRGSIIGPHGSGKSTLLEHLIPRLGTVCVKRMVDSIDTNLAKIEGLRVTWLQLRRSEPNSLILPLANLSSGDLLVLDGYEQLPLIQRAIVVLRTRFRRTGLLVTSHGRTILPTLCELVVTPEVAARIVCELMPANVFPSFGDLTRASNLEQLLKSQHGNMRELLMDLYDRFEEQREASWKTK